MKKMMVWLLSGLMVMGSLVPVWAEGEDQEEYYMELCSRSDLSDAQKAECQDYITQQNAQLQKELSEIAAKRKELETNLAKVGEEIKNYDSQISTLNGQISTLNTQISEKEASIALLEEQIAAKEAEVDALRQKVEERLVRSQQTLHNNQFLDFLMGAEDFTDLLRRIQGLNDIMNYDKQSLEELNTLMQQLDADKQQLDADKQQLETDRASVEEKKAQVVAMKVLAEATQEEYQRQQADLEAEGNQISGSLSTLQGMLNSLGLGSIESSSGWIRPASGRISAGTWYYGGGLNVNGGVHLGMDIANSIGTPIYAAGNGVILAAADGCSNDGYIGNACGEAQGGSRGGGNQVYLLTNIDGVTYAVKYLHMSPGLSVSVGDIVSAGDQLGLMGASGNVTGAHVHVEVFRLGTMSIESYASSWNGDLAFGAGWGSSALSRICSNSGTPCRIRPESVFS